jgi:cytochrome c553
MRTAIASALLAALLLAAATGAVAQRPDLARELEQCAACHGADGRSSALPENGRIAGQNVDYLVYILKQYRAGRLQGLNGGLMTSAMRHLTDAQIVEIARWYAELP